MTETMRKGSGVSGALVDVRLSVLGYCEDSQWAALALEMDLRGYGETFEDALADLQDLIQMQISFALYKGHLEMIFKDAEPVYWQLFDRVRRAALAAKVGQRGEDEPGLQVGELEIPPPHVIEAHRSDYSQADA